MSAGSCPLCQTALIRDPAGEPHCPVCAAPATVPATQRTLGTTRSDPPLGPDGTPLPERVGRFKIESWLGEGTFGVVYRAFDPLLKREVALKVLKTAGASPDASPVPALLAEAQAAAHLRHSHVVPIFEVQADGPARYIASAFIPGQTVAARLKALPAGARLPVGEAVALTRKLARALDYAHRQGVVHRDVKPGNVLLDPDGEPVLVDFGLAARGDDGAGQAGGTPAYMAPEQWRGEAVPASDQYSLGCFLFELLAGERPFHGRDAIHLRALHENQPAPSARSVNKALPRDLAAICAKALAKDAAKRYASCADLADDLARWEAGRPIRARPVGWPERAAKWVRRNPVVSSLSAAVFLVLAAGLVVSVHFAFAARWEAKQAEENRLAAERQKATAIDQARRATLARHAIQIGGSLRALREGDVLSAERTLDEIDPALRDSWEARHVRARAGRTTFGLHAGDLPVRVAAWSRDGHSVLVSGDDAAVRVWDVVSARVTATLRQAGAGIDVDFVAWSPDERHVFGTWGEGGLSGRRRASVWDVQSGALVANYPGAHADIIGRASWSPDSRHVVTAHRDGNARVWDALRGEVLVVFPGHKQAVHCVAYSPDGRRVVSGGLDNIARIWNPRTGGEEAVLVGHNREVNVVRWSPDGRRLLTAGENQARIWDADTGKEIAVLAGHGNRINRAAWSPDGRAILTASQDGTARIWDASTGAKRLILKGHRLNVSAAAWSPDGRHVLTGSDDTTVRLWDPHTGQERSVLRGHHHHVTSAAWSPDGRYVLTGSMDGTVLIWEAHPELDATVCREHAAAVVSVAWSADSSQVMTGGADGTTRTWDARSGQSLVVCDQLPEGATVLAWSPDRLRLLVGHEDGTAHVLDARSGREVARQPGHVGGVTSAGWSPDGRRVVTGGADGAARVWDAATGQEVVLLAGHADAVVCVAWSPDGRAVLTGSKDRTARVWHADGGGQTVLHGHRDRVNALAWSPDGRRLAAGGRDGTARIWDARSAQEGLVLAGHTGSVSCVGWSPDGRHLLTGGEDGKVRVWDADTGLVGVTFSRHTLPVAAVAWNPGGGQVVSAGWDAMTRVWDPATGQEVRALGGHKGRVSEVVWSPDGGRLLTTGWDGVGWIWDTASWREERAIAFQEGWTNGVCWSPDGKHVLVRDYHGVVRAWSGADGRPVPSWDGPTPPWARSAVSPDGLLVAKARRRHVLLTPADQPAVSRPVYDAPRQRAFHVENARIAEEDGHWFAVAFHLDQLLRDAPEDVALKERRDAALQRHAGK